MCDIYKLEMFNIYDVNVKIKTDKNVKVKS